MVEPDHSPGAGRFNGSPPDNPELRGPHPENEPRARPERSPTLRLRRDTVRKAPAYPRERLPGVRRPLHFALLAPEALRGKPDIARKQEIPLLVQEPGQHPSGALGHWCFVERLMSSPPSSRIARVSFGSTRVLAIVPSASRGRSRSGDGSLSTRRNDRRLWEAAVLFHLRTACRSEGIWR